MIAPAHKNFATRAAYRFVAACSAGASDEPSGAEPLANILPRLLGQLGIGEAAFADNDPRDWRGASRAWPTS